jgi:hypothetical protein
MHPSPTQQHTTSPSHTQVHKYYSHLSPQQALLALLLLLFQLLFQQGQVLQLCTLTLQTTLQLCFLLL